MKLANKVKEINTQIRMGRYHNGDGKFYLEIEDESSGLIILRAEFGAEEFADILTNRQAKDCKTTYYNSPDIGKKHECQEIKIDFSKLKPPAFKNFEDTEKDLNRIYDEAERLHPGWKADRDNHLNFHYKTNVTYRVIIRRYV